MSKTFLDLAFLDLFPSSISGDKKIQAAATGAGAALTGAYENIPLVKLLSRIDELPGAVLDLLGWQFHVDYWGSDWSLERRRSLIKEAIQWHRHKGTPGLIEQILADVAGVTADILEWYEYQGDTQYLFTGEPYHFCVMIDTDQFRALTTEEINQLFAIVRHYKNTRSWMDGLFHAGRAGMEVITSGGSVAVGRDQGGMINHIQHTAQGQAQYKGGAVSTVTDYARAEYTA